MIFYHLIMVSHLLFLFTVTVLMATTNEIN